MGIFDDSDGQTAKPSATETAVAESASNLLGLIPGVGTVMGIGNMAYHGGSAIYDGLHGDRDGAVAHGTQALMSAAGALPMVGDAISAVDTGIASGATSLRAMAPGMGVDPSQIPSSISDMAASAAVFGTNALFGADDSNWIEDGDKPTGTRAGEIQAGADVLGYAIGGPIFGDEAGEFLGPLMKDAGEFFGSDLAGPTSGVQGADGKGSYAQDAGEFIHNAPGMFGDYISDLVSSGAPAPAAGGPMMPNIGGDDDLALDGLYVPPEDQLTY